MNDKTSKHGIPMTRKSIARLLPSIEMLIPIGIILAVLLFGLKLYIYGFVLTPFNNPTILLKENPVISRSLTKQFRENTLPQAESGLFQLSKIKKISFDCSSYFGKMELLTDDNYRNSMQVECYRLRPFNIITIIKSDDGAVLTAYTDGKEKENTFSEYIMQDLLKAMNNGLEAMTDEVERKLSWEDKK
jgi:hypothetical protein